MSHFNPQPDVLSASPQPSGSLPPSAAEQFASNQAVPVGGLPSAEHASPKAQACEAPDDGAEPEVGERSFQQPRLTGRRPGRRLVKPEEQARAPFTAAQRLLILD